MAEKKNSGEKWDRTKIHRMPIKETFKVSL